MIQIINVFGTNSLPIHKAAVPILSPNFKQHILFKLSTQKTAPDQKIFLSLH